MKHHNLFKWLLGVCISLPMMLQAETPSHLVVHQTDGNKVQIDLQQTPRLNFEADNLVLTIGEQTQKLPYDNVQRLTFEDALSNAVENVEVAGCRVIVADQAVHISAEQTICGLQVWNLQGQLVYSLPYGEHGLQLSIPATWNAGVYIVGVETVAATSAHKIIIQ